MLVIRRLGQGPSLYHSIHALNTNQHQWLATATERRRFEMNTVWRTMGMSLSLLTCWLIMSVAIGLLVELLVIDLVTLGPRFLYFVVVAGVLTLIATSGATIWLAWKSKKEPDGATENRWTRTHTVVAIVFVALMVVSIPLTGIVSREIEEFTNRAAAEEGRQTFTVANYSTGGEGFDEEALGETLAELEESYRKLKNEWELPDEPGIHVRLFDDLDTYQKHAGRPASGGHLSCTENGPVISIPLENAPSVSTSDNFTRTPVHEVAHALICLSTGREAFYSIPRWFHEGIAQRYEVRGISRIRMRAENRARTWWNKDELLEPERFCTRRFIPKDRAEQSMLYRTSLEFIEFLDSKYGGKNVNLIIDDIRRGVDFNDSMQRRFGGECNDLYRRWIGSF